MPSSGENRSPEAASPGADEVEQAYQYIPLESAPDEIRLVYLLPATDKSAEIEVELIHTTLTEAEDCYYALSYTWGVESDKTPITLQGCTFCVTRNLDSALRHLRREEEGLMLWIDFISINQEDFDERASQVTRMREIYSSAVQVLAWIGPADDDTPKAFDFIHDIAVRVTQDKMEITDDTRQWMSAAVRDTEKYSWKGLQQVMNRPFWSRVWIIQEVVMSKLTEVCCGHLRLPWNFFVVLQGAVHGFLSSITKSLTEQYFDEIKAAGGEVDPLAAMSYGRGMLSEGFGKILQITTARVYYQHDRYDTFYDITRNFRSAEATDPRDKIYALLGLAAEKHSETLDLKPDYTINIDTLFRRAIVSHVKAHKKIDFLWDSCGIDRPEGFSSWMPHWGRANQISRMRFEEINKQIIFSAASDVAPYMEFDDEDHILKIKCILIDIVQKLGDVLELRPGALDDGSMGPDSITSTMARWASLANAQDTIALVRSNKKVSEQKDGEEKVSEQSEVSTPAFMAKEDVKEKLSGLDPRTPLAALLPADEGMKTETGQTYQWFKEQQPGDQVLIIEPQGRYADGTPIKEAFTRTTLMNPTAPLSIDYRDYSKPVNTGDGGWEVVPSSLLGGFSGYHQARRAEVCSGRRFYVGSNKFMGIVVPEARPGDFVGVPLGAKTPFLFRRENGRFLVVGEAYVQGMMNGEAVFLEQHGKFAMETLSLI